MESMIMGGTIRLMREALSDVLGPLVKFVVGNQNKVKFGKTFGTVSCLSNPYFPSLHWISLICNTLISSLASFSSIDTIYWDLQFWRNLSETEFQECMDLSSCVNSVSLEIALMNDHGLFSPLVTFFCKYLFFQLVNNQSGPPFKQLGRFGRLVFQLRCKF